MEPTDDDVMEPRFWKKHGWSARVVRNDDGEGWAVQMIRQGDDEPLLVAPWTMGRDKVNPKPLGPNDYATLVKAANDVLLRHEASHRERLHRTLSFATAAGVKVRADLDVAQDDDDPHAMLTVTDETTDEVLHSDRVSPAFKLSAATVEPRLKARR